MSVMQSVLAVPLKEIIAAFKRSQGTEQTMLYDLHLYLLDHVISHDVLQDMPRIDEDRDDYVASVINFNLWVNRNKETLYPIIY